MLKLQENKCKQCGGDIYSRNATATFCSDDCRSEFTSASKNLTDSYIKVLLKNRGLNEPSGDLVKEIRMTLKIKRLLYEQRRKIDTQGDNGRVNHVLQGTNSERRNGQEDAIHYKPGQGYRNDSYSYAQRANNGGEAKSSGSIAEQGRDNSNQRHEKDKLMEGNPFQILSDKLDYIISRLDGILESPISKPSLMSLPAFCKKEGISRVTCYSWAQKGILKLTKIGGRQFVELDSIVPEMKKYRR